MLKDMRMVLVYLGMAGSVVAFVALVSYSYFRKRCCNFLNKPIDLRRNLSYFAHRLHRSFVHVAYKSFNVTRNFGWKWKSIKLRVPTLTTWKKRETNEGVGLKEKRWKMKSSK